MPRTGYASFSSHKRVASGTRQSLCWQCMDVLNIRATVRRPHALERLQDDAQDAGAGADDEALGEGEMDADEVAEQRQADDFATAQDAQPKLELPEGLELGGEDAEASDVEGGDEGDGAGQEEGVHDGQEPMAEQEGASTSVNARPSILTWRCSVAFVPLPLIAWSNLECDCAFCAGRVSEDGEDATETQAPDADERMDEDAAEGDGAPDKGVQAETDEAGADDSGDAPEAAPIQAEVGEDEEQDKAAPSGPQGDAGGTEAAEMAGALTRRAGDAIALP